MNIGVLMIGIVLVVLYVWYATIVKRRNRVSEALAGIDVQLQQRLDLIPNVLTTARRFMDRTDEVDAIMREQVRLSGGGFKLGPFELLDLTGLDVSQPVMESIYRQVSGQR